MEKLLVSLREETLRTITHEARRRGISVQELLRAVIIPDWVIANIRRPTLPAPPPENVNRR